MPLTTPAVTVNPPSPPEQAPINNDNQEQAQKNEAEPVKPWALPGVEPELMDRR